MKYQKNKQDALTEQPIKETGIRKGAGFSLYFYFNFQCAALFNKEPEKNILLSQYLAKHFFILLLKGKEVTSK